MALVNARNKVPEHQVFYQNAYKNHQRLWKINPRSKFLMVPYLALLWGGFAGSVYMGVRKVAGHNTWLGEN